MRAVLRARIGILCSRGVIGAVFLFAICCLMLSAACPCGALADGDPASDVLISQNAFFPYDEPVDVVLRGEIDRQLAAMARAGDPLKVALIPTRFDLGAITPLFDKPQLYASFLDDEISLGSPVPLLVVMPNGYGVKGLDQVETAAVAALPPPGAHNSDALAGAAIEAIDAISHAAGDESREVRSKTAASIAGRTSALVTARDVIAAILGALILLTAVALGVSALRR